MMSRVKSKDTEPEMIVRRMLHAMGYRYRLHVKELPGKPDVVLPRHRKIVFVNGCFWHGHADCRRAERPSTNAEFWNRKISKNIERDENNKKKLESLGWKMLVVWGCEVKDAESLRRRLQDFMGKGGKQ